MMAGRMHPPHIRQGTRGDLDAVEALENAVFAMDRLSRRSLAYFLATPTAALLLAHSGQNLDAYSLTAFRKNSRIARIYSIAVAAHAAGRGLGRVLLEACELEARERGARLMRLEVRPDNHGAIRLYQQMGFRTERTFAAMVWENIRPPRRFFGVPGALVRAGCQHHGHRWIFRRQT